MEHSIHKQLYCMPVDLQRKILKRSITIMFKVRSSDDSTHIIQ